MQKIKSLNFSGFFRILKSVLLALVVTLVGIVILAVVLKFADLSSMAISYINDAIKAIAIFVMILTIKKSNPDKLLLKAILSGVLYALLSYVVFSILNGGFTFNLSFIYDLLFSIIVSVIAAIIFNILSRKAI